MSKEPKIDSFYDEEEKHLIKSMEEAINRDDFVPKSVITDAMLEEHKAAARNTLQEQTVPVTIRISRSDLIRLKGQASREGIPYQTWIKSILHKSAVQ